MNILVIATQLPPYIGSANIRALNYINYLSKMGNKVDVIGVDYPHDSVAYDESLEDAFEDSIKIIRIKPGFLFRFFYRKKYKSNTNNEKNDSIKFTFKNKLSKIIKNHIIIPDQYLFWILPAFNQVKKMLKIKKYDLIFTMHETPSSHVVGYFIKKNFPNIKWVGYWSDPWNGDSLRNSRGLLKRLIEERIEKKVINSIDGLLFTTEKTKELYIKKYNLDPSKCKIAYRGFSRDIILKIYKQYSKKDLPQLDVNKINILHTGTIYHELRDIVPLSRALDRLKNERPDIYFKLNILFIGQFDNNDDQEEFKKHSVVKILPFMPHEDVQKYIALADILLLYGNKNSTQIPGKVYEYFGSKAYILTVLGDENDDLQYLMKDANKGPIINNNEGEIYSALVIINDGLNNQFSNKPYEQYEWENVVKDLEKKLSFYR